jgi:hypothetical protein
VSFFKAESRGGDLIGSDSSFKGSTFSFCCIMI